MCAEDAESQISLVETRRHHLLRPEAVRCGNASAPAGVADLLKWIAAEVQAHTRKQELVLFALMRWEAIR